MRRNSLNLQVEDMRIYQVLDAAVNRACEGMRVCEELFRFTGISSAYERLKGLRHRLRGLVEPFKSKMLEERDSVSDVGRYVGSVDSEYKRRDEDAVFRANVVRAQEGMRVVEESLKIIDPKKAKVAEQIRFDLYTLEHDWSGRLSVHRMLKEARLYCIVSDGFGKDVVDASSRLAGVADIVQLRMKRVSDAELLKTAERVKRRLEGSGTIFVVNDRVDIACAVCADGLHLGIDDIPVSVARRLFRGIIGATVHNRKELKKAQEENADYLGVGSFYRSRSKRSPVGGLKLAEMMEGVDVIWFAIGGIEEDKLDELVTAGVRRICVSGAVMSKDDMRDAAARLKKRLTELSVRMEA